MPKVSKANGGKKPKLQENQQNRSSPAQAPQPLKSSHSQSSQQLKSVKTNINAKSTKQGRDASAIVSAPAKILTAVAAPVPSPTLYVPVIIKTEDHIEAATGQQRTGLRLGQSVGDVSMPGDEFVVESSDGPVILGPGLQVKVTCDGSKKDKIVSVTKAGVLIQRKAQTFYIDMTARSYLPCKHDDVVGVITKRSGDQYVVDIGTRDRVTLSKFAFEGATKKNKPELKIGDIVFGRFMDVPSDFPFEITCVTASGKAMGLGPLEGGFLFQIPSPSVKVLQTTKKQGGSDIIRRLGQMLPFEITLGVNGYIWVKSNYDLANILIARTIESVSNLPPEEHDQLLSAFRTSLESVQGIMTSK